MQACISYCGVFDPSDLTFEGHKVTQPSDFQASRLALSFGIERAPRTVANSHEQDLLNRVDACGPSPLLRRRLATRVIGAIMLRRVIERRSTCGQQLLSSCYTASSTSSLARRGSLRTEAGLAIANFTAVHWLQRLTSAVYIFSILLLQVPRLQKVLLRHFPFEQLGSCRQSELWQTRT